MGPLAWLMSLAAARFPAMTERFYATGVYPIIATALSYVARLIPVSLAEILLLLLIGYLTFALGMAIKRRLLPLVQVVARTALYASVLYFLFTVLWGLNYHRLPFATIASLDTAQITRAELVNLCQSLIEQANQLRDHVSENSEGVMQLLDSPRDALGRVQLGYDRVAVLYPELNGRYSRPRGALSSTVLSYMGIAGIYSPFTGEAHVNIRMPHSTIPAAAAHEAAHQHGFSREDEANFLGYLACFLHPDVDYQYSGVLMALKYAMNTLFAHDPESYYELAEAYSRAVRRDLSYERTFWEKYQGPVERVADRVNDAYLKANMQDDGVMSYGRMVDLLIAYHRNKS
jgi:hypothetical protein